MLKKSFDDIFSGLTPAKEKYFLCVGGGTCTGKGKITKTFLDEGIIDPGSTLVIKSEFFADLLPGYALYPNQRHPEKKPELIEQFRLARFMLVNEGLKRGVSVLLDDHMDDLGEIQNLVQLAKLHQYQTCLAGSVIKPEDIFIMEERRKKYFGMEPPAKKDYLQWHKSFAQNFPLFKEIFDETLLYHYRRESETPPLVLVNNLMFLKTGEEEKVLRPDLIGVLDALRDINVHATTSEEIMGGSHTGTWRFDSAALTRRIKMVRQQPPENSWQGRVLEGCLSGRLKTVREVIR